MTKENHFYLKLCLLQNLKEHVPLKAFKESLRRHWLLIPDYMIPMGADQKLTFLDISEKSIKMLKSILCQKCLSASGNIGALQNFLWHEDKGESIYLIRCQKNGRWTIRSNLIQSFCFLFTICCSPMWIKWTFVREEGLVVRISLGS